MVWKWYRFEPIVKPSPWMLNMILPAPMLSSILDLATPFISSIRLFGIQNTVIDYIVIILLSGIYLEPVKPVQRNLPSSIHNILLMHYFPAPFEMHCSGSRRGRHRTMLWRGDGWRLPDLRVDVVASVEPMSPAAWAAEGG